MAAVDAERDRRMAVGFVFGGKTFQFRPQPYGDRENINGAAAAALAAMVNGSQAGDYRWADPDSDFGFYAEDNTPKIMDSPTTIAFGQAAMMHKMLHVAAARMLKDMETIPADFADDSYWPS